MSLASIVGRLSREPTLRFALAGGCVFALHAAVATGERPILSTADAPRDALFEAFSLEHGRAPNPDEREALVEGWADERALLRYAYDLELHRADAVVRRRLVQDVKLLLEAEAEPIGEAAVRERYERDQARFRVPAQRSFEHRFFAGRSEASLERARRGSVELRKGRPALDLGDPFSAGTQLEAQTQKALSARFGDTLAQGAFALEEGEWSEPLASPLGHHLLRLVDEQSGHVRELDEVHELLRAELEAELRAQAIAEGTRELRERYESGAPP